MKINLVTLGCPKNLVDSEFLRGALANGKATFVDDPYQADTIIINTCGFIQSAKEESIEAIFEAVKLKTEGLCRQVLVVGCLVNRYSQELCQEIPEVDGFFENRDVSQLAKRLARALEINDQEPNRRFSLTPPHYAYLKIAEGCDNRCTYCAIPMIRGPYRSRPINDLLREAEMLVARGVREIIVVAQDTTMYGWDLASGPDLVTLLKRLSRLEELRWLRLLYTHPAHYTDELIDLVAENEKICKYLDLPLQHISEPVLKAMGRKVTRDQIENLIAKLRQSIPNLALRTTMMVGFPGETERDFEELLNFVAEARFERLGAFTYSREEGTPASRYPNPISPQEKQRRLETLMELQAEISRQHNQSLLGTTIEVLIDTFDQELNGFTGRTQWDSPEIDNTVLVKSSDMPSQMEEVKVGEFCWVTIREASEYDLIGSILNN
ncbi:MAG: 30S ribosomal protein S12 methylthiotransferase RimO [candidate division KSB1 bacterium]|nr:30S ribosomal protein S12 methylthiotransferase RimO [candidate division KSB1 bacterium]